MPFLYNFFYFHLLLHFSFFEILYFLLAEVVPYFVGFHLLQKLIASPQNWTDQSLGITPASWSMFICWQYDKFSIQYSRIVVRHNSYWYIWICQKCASTSNLRVFKGIFSVISKGSVLIWFPGSNQLFAYLFPTN